MFTLSYTCTKNPGRMQRNLVMGKTWGLDREGSEDRENSMTSHYSSFHVVLIAELCSFIH